MNVTLKALVAKLNDTCRAALEGAAGASGRVSTAVSASS